MVKPMEANKPEISLSSVSSDTLKEIPSVIEEAKKKIKKHKKPNARKSAKVQRNVDCTRYTTLLIEKTVLAELQKMKELLPSKPKGNGAAIQELLKIHLDQLGIIAKE